ncbi:uncharacterized protein LOC133528522 isoform X3 [Cydia pomonella]|uniref:uncharacterized protein LOC133528522 isoform X3 n=1 Tax=Cydia pomonella TaxID=82600 RepID=UPI002ADE8128|nr:uncharacterized protein LOC133528522 isoform X3 [Cydia pomonella]
MTHIRRSPTYLGHFHRYQRIEFIRAALRRATLRRFAFASYSLRMAADNLRLQVLCLLIAVIAVTKAYDNFYEFGNYSIGEEYIRKQGSIPAFYYRLDVLVSELENKLVTGVKVVVSGPATPRVSYSRPWVYIQYHFPQWTDLTKWER